MKKIIISLALSLVAAVTVAQQDAQISMNQFNKIAINPGSVGFGKALCATIIGRQQWAGFDGAPQTGLVSVDYGRIFHGGIGLTVDHDQIGMTKNTKAKLAYSYHQMLNIGYLGIGVDAGMIQSSLDGNFIAPDGTQNDQHIPWNGSSITTYDVGFGLYYEIPKMLKVGISALHLPGQAQADKENVAGSEVSLNVARHYYVFTEYTVRVNPSFEVVPAVYAKTVLASTQLDISTLAWWKPNNKYKLFIGGSYRLQDAIIAMGGVQWTIDRRMATQFGYAYDINMSDLSDYNNGSHELMLKFCYKIVPEKKITRHMNVRFL